MEVVPGAWAAATGGSDELVPDPWDDPREGTLGRDSECDGGYAIEGPPSDETSLVMPSEAGAGG